MKQIPVSCSQYSCLLSTLCQGWGLKIPYLLNFHMHPKNWPFCSSHLGDIRGSKTVVHHIAGRWVTFGFPCHFIHNERRQLYANLKHRMKNSLSWASKDDFLTRTYRHGKLVRNAVVIAVLHCVEQWDDSTH